MKATNRILAALIVAFGVTIVVLSVLGGSQRASISANIPDEHHELRLADGIEAPEISFESAVAIAEASDSGKRVGAGRVKEAYLVSDKDVSNEPAEDRLVWALSFEIRPGTRELDGRCLIAFEAAYSLGFVDEDTGEYAATSEGWLLVPGGTPQLDPCP
jgi:hypothetical protein